ncbi:hypothetical protein F4604DRAFT_1521487, partial [Suillus subluteus]
IQMLSAESAFSNKLLSPINDQILTKWVSQGALYVAAGDFMITSTYSIIATTQGSLNSKYLALVIS